MQDAAIIDVPTMIFEFLLVCSFLHVASAFTFRGFRGGAPREGGDGRPVGAAIRGIFPPLFSIIEMENYLLTANHCFLLIS